MSIVKKLRFKEEGVYLLELPNNCIEHFEDIEYKAKLSGKSTIEQVLLFAEVKKILDTKVPRIVDRLSDEALFWIAYPKKSGSISSDISRNSGWDVLKSSGYDPVMQIAINDDWSALRFRKSKNIGPKLRDVPMSERKVEGIDFVNRKVTLPKDVVKVLKQHKELYELFKSQPFTHQKEHVEAIVTAKKAETRVRRINKMIEILQQTLDTKQRKKK